jgi:hypothetical protein
VPGRMRQDIALALLFLSRQTSCRWRGVTVGLFGITDGVDQAEYDEITALARSDDPAGRQAVGQRSGLRR